MSKEQLHEDMKNFLEEIKWSSYITEHINDLKFYEPDDPWIFFYEKNQLKQNKQKLDARLWGLVETAHFIANTRMEPDQTMKLKILELLIDKHSINKFKKPEVVKICQIILLQNNKEYKELILRLLYDKLDDNVTLEKSLPIFKLILFIRKLLDVIDTIQKSNTYILTWKILGNLIDDFKDDLYTYYEGEINALNEVRGDNNAKENIPILAFLQAFLLKLI